MADRDSSLSIDGNIHPENTINTHQATRLVRWIGVIFLVIGIINLFPVVNCINLIICMSIGMGMFEKHAWSRVLAIIGIIYYFIVYSIAISIYLFRSDYANFIQPIFPKELTIALLILELASFGLIFYVLFRSDVKELFESKK